MSIRRRGFTLIELLVVIGIIALLMAILFPSLRAARRQADVVACASNMRQIAAAALAHAAEHRGYMPLAGEIEVRFTDPATGIAASLGDASRQRYTYASAKYYSLITPVPFTAAVAPYMGYKNLDFGDLNTLEAQITNRQTGVVKMFMCPSTDSATRGMVSFSTTQTPGEVAILGLLNYASPAIAFASNSDYAFNEGALGYHYFSRYASRRLAGNTAKFTNASKLLLMGEALPGTARTANWCVFNTHPWLTFRPALNSTGAITMKDVLLKDATKVVPTLATMDTKRHANRMNAAFADGHVEAVRLEAGALSNVYLLLK